MKKLRLVVLVDDNEADNYYHSLIIDEVGITEKVKSFQYAEQALTYMQRKGIGEIDLILLDINMPRMDGFQFLEEHAKLSKQQQASVVIIMLTTSLNPADEALATSYPQVSGFRTKPLTEEMLRDIVCTYF